MERRPLHALTGKHGLSENVAKKLEPPCISSGAYQTAGQHSEPSCPERSENGNEVLAGAGTPWWNSFSPYLRAISQPKTLKSHSHQG